MEDNIREIESLLVKVSDYGKTGCEIIKLKSIDKASDCISSLLTNLIVMIPLSMGLVLLNFSASFWIGECMNDTLCGFLTVAGINGLIALIIYFFMRKWFKRMIYDAVIVHLVK
jgi:Fe2+ transport system protein B